MPEKFLELLKSKVIWITVFCVLTGTLSTISLKASNQYKSPGNKNNCSTKCAEEIPDYCRHPHLQTLATCLGKFLCVMAFSVPMCHAQYALPPNRQTAETGSTEIRQLSENIEEPAAVGMFNLFVILPVAVLDICATPSMYIGLTLTTASNFEMLSCSVIVFTGILSRICLAQ